MKRKQLMRKVTEALLAAAMVVIGAPAATAPAFADEASSAIVPMASFSEIALTEIPSS